MTPDVASRVPAHVAALQTPVPGRTIGRRLAEVAAARPDAIAVRSSGRILTWAELAVAVADRVRELRGVTAAGPPGAPIAVDVGADPGALVAVAAILVAGRRVVALDPLLTAADRLLVAERSGAIRWMGTGTPAGGVAVDEAGSGAGRFAGAAGPARDASAPIAFGPADRVGLALPLAAQAGLDIAFAALTAGAAVVLADPRVTGLPALLRRVRAAQVTTLHTTPAGLDTILGRLATGEPLPALRLVTTTGDPGPAPSDHRLRRHLAPTARHVGWPAATAIPVGLGPATPERPDDAASGIAGAPRRAGRATTPAPHRADRSATAPAPHRTPESLSERVLARAWGRALGVGDLSVDTDVWSLGVDAAGIAELILEVEAATGLTVTHGDLVGAPTIAALAAVLEARTRPPADLPPTAVRLRGGAAGPAVFAFAGGGAHAASLLPIARGLSGDVGVHAFHASGYLRRGLPDWALRHAVRRHLDVIRRVAPTGPKILVGHSFGGLLALEAAAQLEARGAEIPLVVLLDPHVPGTVARALEPGRPATPAPPRSERMRMHARLLGAGLLRYPPAVRDAVFWEQSLRMANRHRPKRWTGRTLVFLAPENGDDPRWWSHLLGGPHEVCAIDGEHSSILRAPFNRPIVARLDAELAALRERDGDGDGDPALAGAAA